MSEALQEPKKLYSGKTHADYIPSISEQRLQELAARMKPIVERKGKLRFVECDLKTFAFTWAEKDNLGKIAPKLEPVREVITYHGWAYYGFFKPSQYEVLAQLNHMLTEDELSGIIAYRTIGPQTSEDLGKNQEELNDGFHVAKTTLYRLK